MIRRLIALDTQKRLSMMRMFYFRLLVVAVFLLCVVNTPLLIAQRAVEIKGSDTEKSVRIQYIPGLSNSKKLANPFEETYSTLYLLQGEGGHSLFFVLGLDLARFPHRFDGVWASAKIFRALSTSLGFFQSGSFFFGIGGRAADSIK